MVKRPGIFRTLSVEQFSFAHPEADKIQPDVMSFTAVIGAHARGSCVEGARELFLAKHFEQAEVDNHDDYPIIYWVLTIPGGAGFLSINSIKGEDENPCPTGS